MENPANTGPMQGTNQPPAEGGDTAQPEKYHSIPTPIFSRDFLPDFTNAKKYRKKVLTRAIRIVYPFTVETSEGNLHCQDGYLAIDARGYPYPIAKEEFEKIYVEDEGKLFA